MKSVLFFVLPLFLGLALTSFDKSAFYQSLKSESLEEIQLQIEKIDEVKDRNIDAYKGTLLIKMSKYLSAPKDKLTSFNRGKALLESAIKAYPKNVEYRFLRLTIQENCPKMLNYNQNIQEDKELVLQHFNEVDATTKKAITTYASAHENGALKTLSK